MLIICEMLLPKISKDEMSYEKIQSKDDEG